MGYIKYCTDIVTMDRCIRIYPNQKLWMTREVQCLLKEKGTAFRSGERAQYSAARANLKRGIREAKAAYRRKIDNHFHSNDTRQVWEGVQHMTNHRSSNLSVADIDASMAEELNHFFAPEAATFHPKAHCCHIFIVEEQEVRRTLRAVNPRKAAGPDGITGRVFTKIFKQSLSQSTIPPCLKSSLIVPLQKKANHWQL